jgi:hypothetical protein
MTPIKSHDTNCLAISIATTRKHPIATTVPITGYMGINTMPKTEHIEAKVQKIICIISASLSNL